VKKSVPRRKIISADKGIDPRGQFYSATLSCGHSATVYSYKGKAPKTASCRLCAVAALNKESP